MNLTTNPLNRQSDKSTTINGTPTLMDFIIISEIEQRKVRTSFPQRIAEWPIHVKSPYLTSHEKNANKSQVKNLCMSIRMGKTSTAVSP